MLFKQEFKDLPNLLPVDGELYYLPSFFDRQQSKEMMDLLHASIHWEKEKFTLFGKTIELKRKVAWYGDPGLCYRYSGNTKIALNWSDELVKIRTQLELVTGERFNSCLLNYYHNGSESMGWHRDNEPELVKNAAIASLSFGEERMFKFKHLESGNALSIQLETGSLLLMKGSIQEYWLHALPKTTRSTAPRMNLTFRLLNT